MLDDGKQRHAEQHADKAEQAAEQQNREQHPEAGQTGGVAKNLRAKNIAVKLLQQQDKDQKVQRLQRRHDKDDDKRRNGTDKRAKERDDIGYTDNDADQHRKRHIHHVENNHGNQKDNKRVEQLACDKAGKCLIGKSAVLHNDIAPSLAQHRINAANNLPDKILFARQQINRNDDADKNILEHSYRVHDTDGNISQRVYRRCKRILDEFFDVADRLRIGVHDGFLAARIILYDEILHRARQVHHIARQRCRQTRHAGNQLRNNQRQQAADNRACCEKCREHRKNARAAHRLSAAPVKRVCEQAHIFVPQPVIRRGQHVGDADTDNNRHENIDQLADAGRQSVELKNTEENSNRHGAGYDDGRAPADVFLHCLFHGKTPFGFGFSTILIL